MYARKLCIVACAMAGLALAGCSDSSNPKPEAGVDSGTRDLARQTDGGSTSGDQGTPDSTDGGAKVDTGSQGSECEQACMDLAPVLCVTDPTDAESCVECTKDAHCTGNSNAFGPVCDTDQSYCGCTEAAHCASNPWGKKCSAESLCSCEKDEDCPNGKICGATIQGLDSTFCVAACKTDTDCKASTAPICDTTSGKCIACKQDADCKADYAPYCDTTLKACVECTGSTHCAANMLGTACVAGSCACDTDNDCKGANPWGNKCVTKQGQDGTNYKACGCDAGTDCTDNANGPSCFDKFQKCSCTTKTDCTKGSLTACAPPYADAEYSHCQAACATDTDCKASGLEKCNTQTGICVGCLGDGDCTSDAPICDDTSKMCVGCRDDNDCKDADAPFCDAGQCGECRGNADCADSKDGKVCSDGACTCAADTDCGGGSWGNKCVDVFLGLMRCACEAATDCTGNANGSVCDDQTYNICSCGGDADCKDATNTKCGPPFPGAAVDSCHKPCAKDEDCTLEGVGLCDVASKLCISCKKNEDCSYSPFERTCDTASSGCVECLSDNDCTASSLGPKCNVSDGYCECASDTDCASNPNGKVCHPDIVACSCAEDNDCANGTTCTGTYGDLTICK